MRQKVRLLSWNEYFAQSNHVPFLGTGPGVLLTVLIGLLLAGWALTSGEGRVFSVAYVAILLGLFYQAQSIARGLIFKRKLPQEAQENEKLWVSFEIYNGSSFTLWKAQLTDQFSGARASKLERWVSDSAIGPRTWIRGKYDFLCDAGMGLHDCGPLFLDVSDALGIFRFRVYEEETQTVEVLPQRHLGAPMNFLGERATGQADLTLCLDLDERQNGGANAESSAEYIKNAALMVLRESRGEFPRFQWFSQAGGGPYFLGAESIDRAVREIARLETTVGESQTVLLERALSNAPHGSSLLWIAAIEHPDVPRLTQILARARASAIQVSCILIETASFTAAATLGQSESYRLAGLAKTQKLYKALYRLEIPTYPVKKGTQLESALLAPSEIQWRGAPWNPLRSAPKLH